MKQRMTLTIAAILAMVVGIAGIPSAHAQTVPPVCNTTPQGTAITSALLTRALPCQVEAVAPFDLVHLQDAFDFYSWLTFIAINAPADSTSPIGKDAPTVWESWKNAYDIMVKPGQTPPAWNAKPTIPAVCQVLPHDPRSPVLNMAILNAFDQPFNTGPLIDKKGLYVRYEILVNEPMFDYIVANKLYSQSGQAAFTGTVAFPGGTDTDTMGAIMVKAAWKVLQPGEQATGFHTEMALLYTPASSDPVIAETCTAKPVALVGLHVGHKTLTDPQWLWSTYEQAANAPSQADIDAKQLLPSYSFYDSGCAPGKCPINVTPPRPWNPNAEPVANGFHSQIVRVTALTAATVALNDQFHAILKGTVWENYNLISTQWPTNAQSKTDPTGAPAPRFLANTTMETYIQGNVPMSSSNCIECHNNATTKVNTKPSDFTYILERAQ